MKPDFKQWRDEHANLMFATVDADDGKKVVAQCGVAMYPTFQVRHPSTPTRAARRPPGQCARSLDAATGTHCAKKGKGRAHKGRAQQRRAHQGRARKCDRVLASRRPPA